MMLTVKGAVEPSEGLGHEAEGGGGEGEAVERG